MLLFVVLAIACATLACCLYRSGQLRAWYRQLSVTLGFRRSLWPPYFYTNVRGRACTELADSDVVLGAYWDDLHTWFTDESGSEERLYRGPIIVPFVETVKDAEPLVAVLQSLWALLHLTTKYSYIKHAELFPYQIVAEALLMMHAELDTIATMASKLVQEINLKRTLLLEEIKRFQNSWDYDPHRTEIENMLNLILHDTRDSEQSTLPESVLWAANFRHGLRSMDFYPMDVLLVLQYYRDLYLAGVPASGEDQPSPTLELTLERQMNLRAARSAAARSICVRLAPNFDA
ncbi:hypothetical protein JCM3774_006517 [Rhodotorula dairenensis]